MGLVGGIVLARILLPSAFGEFAIAYFLTTIFALFSELGLGAAFIRRPGEVTDAELRALFTFQLIVVCVLAAVMVAGAPLVSAAYHDTSLRPLITAVAIAFVLMSLRTVPTVISERQLAFGRIALADTVGQVGYWLVAVGGALAGFQVWSLVAALITSSALGTAILYATTGWRPRMTTHLQPIRQSVRFGILYQSQTAASFLKDAMAAALGGLLYGTAAVGYLTWAMQLAGIPNQLTQLVGRVSYPAYSKLQEDRAEFSKLVASTLKWTARLSLPAFGILIGLTHPIIVFVYGSRWLPAEPALYVLYVNMILGVATGTLIPAIYSVGRAGVGLAIQTGWTLLTWLSAIALFGAGFSFTSLAAAISAGTVVAAIVTIAVIYRMGVANLLRPLVLPLLTSAAVAIILHVASPTIVHGLISLLLTAVVGAVIAWPAALWTGRVEVGVYLRTLMNRPRPVANSAQPPPPGAPE
jgi:O-antigen/teichoic acid export membrane protein